MNNGDCIRLIKGTQGFRASQMYTSIPVPAGTFCIVVGSKQGWTKVATLKYVKKLKAWKPTKVVVSVVESDDPYHGEGHLWERVSVLDRVNLGLATPS